MEIIRLTNLPEDILKLAFKNSSYLITKTFEYIIPESPSKKQAYVHKVRPTRKFPEWTGDSLGIVQSKYDYASLGGFMFRHRFVGIIKFSRDWDLTVFGRKHLTPLEDMINNATFELRDRLHRDYEYLRETKCNAKLESEEPYLVAWTK